MAKESYTRDPKELGEKLWTLKSQGILCNATIIVDDQRIPVHADVLASSSEYFKINLKSEDLEPKEISFIDCKTGTVQSIIEYCYKGTIDITENNATDIHRLADVLQLPVIVEKCAGFLKKNLNIANWLSTLNEVSDENLKKYILSFVKKNLNKISNSKDILEIEYSDMKKLLSSEEKSESEKYVFDALKRWINHDVSRADNLDELLSYIDLTRLPKDFLLSEAQSMCDLNSSCLLKFLAAVKLKNSEYTLVVMGGGKNEQAKIIEAYDLNQKEWFTINFDECKKERFGIVMYEEKIMIIGGSLNDSVYNTVEYYDLITGKIESLSPLNQARHYVTAVEFKKSIYAFGGWGNSVYLSSVEKWTPTTKTWTVVAPMKTARESVGAVVFGDEIFVIGGFDGGNKISVNEAYKPDTDTWRSCSAMNEAIHSPGLAVIGDFIYAVGGKVVQRYDTKNDKWTTIHNSSPEKYLVGAGMFKGHIVMTGGVNSSQEYISSVEVYDEEQNEWKAIAPLKKARSFHHVVSVPWQLAEQALERKN